MERIKLIKLCFSTIMLLLLTSCDSSFLEESPTNFSDPNALLTDKKGAEIYTVGTYNAARVLASGPNGWFSMWGTLGADELVVPNWGGDTKAIYLQSLSPSNATLRSMWENLYISINRANSAIDRISDMTEDQIDAESKGKLVGESRFIRALLYFALVNTWENVPLIKNETTTLANLEVSQATPKEVYEFIIEDLLFAESVLDEGQGGGRVTKGAAQAFLGKVYLQMTGFPLNETDKYALAEVKLKAVMDSGVYELLNFYPDVFDISNEQNSEIVFSIGFDGPGLNQGGQLGTFYGPEGQAQNGGQSGNSFYVNWELAGNSDPHPIGAGTWAERNNYKFAQGYHEDDIRCRNNIAKHNVNEPQGWTPEDGMYNAAARKANLAWRKPIWKAWKWHNIRPSNWANDTPFDQPVIRYADVLLMYAEALNGQGKLTQNDIEITVNRLRTRATIFPDEVKPQDVAPLMILSTQQDNADEILSERRKELCFEGWRRNDLIRFGRYQEAINSNQPAWSNSGNAQLQYSDFEIRWPIPASEILINHNLIQNPGYE
tara:strand:- start:6941 stop:8581 length:1641 start_codon:yes stop_codon:yes gene_type:complete